MSVLRLYDDVSLINQISVNGDFSYPDSENSLDGTNGETVIKPLWIAVEQTVLAADIADTVTTAVSLSASRFADTDYSVIIVGDEKMLITAGHGSTNLTVIRGHGGTVKSSHTAGDAVRMAYDCSSITIDCLDNEGDDESGWVSYCDDDGAGNPDGSYASPHSVSDLACNQKAAIHRKVVVPASTPAAFKRDLVHRLAATVNEYAG